MNGMYGYQNNTLKGRMAILVLTVISLIMSFVYTIYTVAPDIFIDLGIYMSTNVFTILAALFYVLASALLMVYILVYQRKGTAAMMVNAVFGIIAATPILTVLLYVTNDVEFPTETIIGVVVILISFGLAAAFASNAKYRKIFMIIAACVGIVDRVAMAIDLTDLLDYGDYLMSYFMMEMLGVVAPLLLFTAMLVYGICSDAPVGQGMAYSNMQYGGMPYSNAQYGNPNMQYGNPNMQYGNPNMQYGNPNMQYGGAPYSNTQYGNPDAQYGNPNMQYGAPNVQYGNPNAQYGGMPTPEQMIADLDNKLRNGMITPEEYYRQRAEILGGYGR